MTYQSDDGRINRDGITQGSGYGDTEAKARDAEVPPPTDDYDRARAGEEPNDLKKNSETANDTNKDSPIEKP